MLDWEIMDALDPPQNTDVKLNLPVTLASPVIERPLITDAVVNPVVTKLVVSNRDTTEMSFDMNQPPDTFNALLTK